LPRPAASELPIRFYARYIAPFDLDARRALVHARTSHRRRFPVKAILCTRYGSPDDLVLADIAEPVAAAGEVVVKVAAVGLNFFDTLIIAGKYQRKPPFPFSPGGEFTGVVERAGAGVDGFAPGDRVLGYVTFGAARERVAAAVDDRPHARRRARHHLRHGLSRAA